MSLPKEIGQYQVISEISHSSITTVYRAHQPSLNRQVLIKKLHPHLMSEDDIRERFVREGRVCAQIIHPNIVEIYDFHTSPQDIYLVLEYVEGMTINGNAAGLAE